MSASIAFILPHEELADVAREYRQKAELPFDVHVAMMEEAIPLARELMAHGTKIFVSRGETANVLNAQFPNRVVDIEIGFDDVVSALEKALPYGKHILVISFINHVHSINRLGALIGVNIEQIILKNSSEVEAAVRDAKERGVEVLVCGAKPYIVAQKMGIPAVFIRSGTEAIRLAHYAAQNVLNLLLEEERKQEEIRAILEHDKDGFVAIDRSGRVTLLTNAAAQMLGISAEQAIGKPIEKAIALLGNLRQALMRTAHLHTDVITCNGNAVLYRRVPLMRNNEVIGAIAILKDSKIVQADDTKLRVNQYIKGLYAKYEFGDIVGVSEAIENTKSLALDFAQSEATVLITGETGSGKELFAQSIHNASKRRNEAFLAINCAALSESILESELFGYVDGAFTGARKGGKAGIFEMAKRGTIFLDEIGEITPSLQTKLLRVLQERTVRRVGGDGLIPVDVRVIAGTNKNLAQAVRNGTFRQDLFYRLNVLRLSIPPLRTRKKDIPDLIRTFAQKYEMEPGRMAPYYDLLESYDWPGNIRELENLVERVSATNPKRDVGALIREHIAEFTQEQQAPKVLTEELVMKTLEACDGNKTLAAKRLGINRSTLWRFLTKSLQ